MDTRFSKARKQHKKDIMERKEIVLEIKKEFNKTDKILELGIKSEEIFETIESDFKKKTKLSKIDITILFIAVGLQVARQQLQKNYFTKESRPTDKESAGKTEYDRDQRGKGYYKTSIAEILTNPVPFDTQNGTGIKESINLGGGKGHRQATLGHDPILGLIFGTANIATRTVTLSNLSLESYHIKYDDFITKEGILSKRKGDYFAERADIEKILRYGIKKKVFLEEGIEGLKLFLVSLGKEILHLRSDILSKESLQLPFLSLDMNIVNKLSKYHIDMASAYTVGKQASMSIIINEIVRYIHQLIIMHIENNIDMDLLEVRTRKILSYSNIIASTSNILEVGIRTGLKDSSAINKLDVGGLGVTIYRVISDTKYQKRIKHEFIINKWNELLEDI